METKKHLSLRSQGKEITPLQERCLLDFSNTAKTSVAVLGKKREKWKVSVQWSFLSAYGSHSQGTHLWHVTGPLLTRLQSFYWSQHWPLKRQICRHCREWSVHLANGSQRSTLLLLLLSHCLPPSTNFPAEQTCLSAAHIGHRKLLSGSWFVPRWGLWWLVQRQQGLEIQRMQQSSASSQNIRAPSDTGKHAILERGAIPLQWLCRRFSSKCIVFPHEGTS